MPSVGGLESCDPKEPASVMQASKQSVGVQMQLSQLSSTVNIAVATRVLVCTPWPVR